MKKIIFCLQTMVLGGVERELISILNKFNPNEYDISILLFYEEDQNILKQIPKNVKLISLNIDKDYYCSGLLKLAKLRVKKGKISEAFSIFFKRVFNIGMTQSNTNISDIPLLDEVYDIAVCYHIHSPLMLKYTAEKIKANKKIAWVHNDFKTSKYPVHKLYKFLNYYDEVVCVSNKVKNEFLNFCPNYHGSVSTEYNIIDEEEVLKKSNQTLDDSSFIKDTHVKLLTVGRFTKQKGIDIAIKCALFLRKKGLPYHWYLIGYGDDEAVYRKMINKYQLEDYFIIIGRKENPYPYIKNCDIYVQPSRHEAFGLVLTEAKLLKKPIVCTDFYGADEQIYSGYNGYIVPLNDIDSLSEVLSFLIMNDNERLRLSTALNNENLSFGWNSIIKHF